MQRLLKKPARLSARALFWLKTALHLMLTGLLALQFYQGVLGQLGAEPVSVLLTFTGLHGLQVLMITLLIAPAARLLPCPDLMKLRRMLGLYAFFYGLAHFSTYIVFDLQLNWPQIGNEIIERPYITVGFSALLLLALLAVTSFAALQKRMGRRWQQLHNGVYAALALILLHFSWAQKTWFDDPLWYWAIGAVLMWLRKDKLLAAMQPAASRRRG